MTFELCEECGGKTGRAGRGDDSLHDETGHGPYCKDCFASIANLNNLAAARDQTINQLRNLLDDIRRLTNRADYL